MILKAHMIHIALALACTLLLEPVSGRAILGRDLAPTDDGHGHSHKRDIHAPAELTPRDDEGYFNEDDFHPAPAALGKRTKKTATQRPLPKAPAKPLPKAPPKITRPQTPPKAPVKQTTPKSPVKQTLPKAPVKQTTPKNPVKQNPPKAPVKQATPKPPAAKPKPTGAPAPKGACNGAKPPPGTTPPGKKTTPVPPKKKTSIRSLLSALTRRMPPSRPGSPSPPPVSPPGASCPIVFKANCAAEYKEAEVGIEGPAEVVVFRDMNNSPVLPPADPTDDELAGAVGGLDLDTGEQKKDGSESGSSIDIGEAIRIAEAEAIKFGEEVKAIEAANKAAKKYSDGVCSSRKNYQRVSKYSCKDSSGTFTKEWLIWPYPTPNDLLNHKDPNTAKMCNEAHRGWYMDLARDSVDTSCTDEKMMSMSATNHWGLASKGTVDKGKVNLFNTEHVYEINFIANFLKYLNEVKKVQCKVIDQWITSGYRARHILAQMGVPRGGERVPVYLLINELGSELHMDRLAILDDDVNKLKYQMLAGHVQNPVNMPKFKTADLNKKMTLFRRVCMVMEYLHMTTSTFKATQDAIEKRLEFLDRALNNLIDTSKVAPHNKVENPVGVNLKNEHALFIKGLLDKANAKAKKTALDMLPIIKADPNFTKLDPVIQQKFTKFAGDTNARSFLRHLA